MEQAERVGPPDWESALLGIDEKCTTRKEAIREAYLLGLFYAKGSADGGKFAAVCGAEYRPPKGEAHAKVGARCELEYGHRGSHTSNSAGWSWFTDARRAELAEKQGAQLGRKLSAVFDMLAVPFAPALPGKAPALPAAALVRCYRETYRATPIEISIDASHAAALVAVAEMIRQGYERRLRRL